MIGWWMLTISLLSMPISALPYMVYILLQKESRRAHIGCILHEVGDQLEDDANNHNLFDKNLRQWSVLT